MNATRPRRQPRQRKTELPVRIAQGSAFELITAVSAFLRSDQHPYYDIGIAGFAKLDEQAGDAFAQLRSFAGGSLMVWDRLFGIASELDEVDDTAALIRRIESFDPERLRLELLGIRDRPTVKAVGVDKIEAAAKGNTTAQRDLLRLASPEDQSWQTGARELLRTSPHQTRAALVALLNALDRDLSPLIAPALPALEADAAERRKAALAVTPLALIQMAIDTAYTPTGDVHGVVLIPSYVVRPFVFYVEHADQMLFIYPVADRFLDAIEMGPPDRLVRLAFALGDRGRLQILTILKERDMTLKELEDRLGLPRSTLRHHIGILRGAGLLRPMQSGTGFYRYQLREEAATDLTELLDRFLRR